MVSARLHGRAAVVALVQLARTANAASTSASATVCDHGNTAITEPAQLSSLASCDTYVGTITMMLSQPEYTKVESSSVVTGWTLPVPAIAGELIISQAAPIGGAQGFTVDVAPLTAITTLRVQDIHPLDDFVLNIGTMEVNDVYIRNVSFTSNTFPFADTDELTFLYLFRLVDTNLETLTIKQSSFTPDGTFVTVDIQQNPVLNSITLDLGQEAFITVADNGDQCILDCGAVEKAGLDINGVHTLVAQYVSEIDTLPGDSDFAQPSRVSNTTLVRLLLPGLTTLPYGLIIDSNDELTSVQLDALDSLEGLYMSNNPRLSQLNLPALTTVTSAISISGPFTSVALPALTAAYTGDALVTIDSSQTLHCDLALQNLKNAGDVVGNFTCGNKAASSGNPGLSTGADAGIGVGVGVAALLLIIGGVLFWRRRHRSVKLAADKTGEEGGGQSDSFLKPELDGQVPTTAPIKRSELGDQGVYEMPSNDVELSALEQRHELLSDHGVSEA